MQNQTHCSQPTAHTSQTQDYTMQGPGYQAAYRQYATRQVPPPVQVDPWTNIQPLMDPKMTAEAIKRHFGVQLRPLDRPVYRKSYPDWIDRITLSRGYKTLDFSSFIGEDAKSTMKHISHFTAQCDETNQNEYYKLQLFPLSLTGAAFS